MKFLQEKIIDLAVYILKRVKDKNRKHELLTEVVKHLYNTIGPDDILKINKDHTWRVGNKVLTSSEIKQLKDEVVILRSLKLWKVLMLDVKYQINKKMFEEANDETGMVWGKLMTWYDDIIRTRCERIKKGLDLE